MSVSKKTIEDAQGLIAMKKGDAKSERAMQLKTQWNKFARWAAEKGVAGSPDLDKGVGEQNGGIKLVRQYQKENPGTLITPENIPEIQGHFKNYREHVIDLIKNKKADYSGDINMVDTNFMPHLSKIDGIPGSLTTKSTFPDEWLTTIYKGPGGVVEKQETVNTGLATPTKL